MSDERKESPSCRLANEDEVKEKSASQWSSHKTGYSRFTDSYEQEQDALARESFLHGWDECKRHLGVTLTTEPVTEEPAKPKTKRECITHHYACDCREANFSELKRENNDLKQRIAALEAERDALKVEVERLGAALEKIACFNDTAKHLDEPVSATIAREALK